MQSLASALMLLLLESCSRSTSSLMPAADEMACSWSGMMRASTTTCQRALGNNFGIRVLVVKTNCGETQYMAPLQLCISVAILHSEAATPLT